MYEQILQAIQAYDVIVIHRHTSPDGDAMGSQIGLKAIILDNYPQKRVYIVGDEPKRFSFMDGAVMDEVDDATYENALAIVLDSGASSLIADERWKTAQKTVRFDHHIFVEKAGEEE